MPTTTHEVLAIEHPVVMVALAAALGALLGIGGVAMVAEPDSGPPVTASQESAP